MESVHALYVILDIHVHTFTDLEMLVGMRVCLSLSFVVDVILLLFVHFQTDLEISVESVHVPDVALDFPKRPAWDFSLSKEQLERQEQSYFQV